MSLADELARLAERAKLQGRRWLLEPEVLALLGELGVATPPHHFVEELEQLEHLDFQGLGEQVVVKVVADDLPHKARLGGVRIVATTEVIATARAIAAQLPTLHVRGWLVMAFVPHAAELLIALRSTSAFGPVAVVGFGGGGAEPIGHAIAPAVLSTWTGDPDLVLSGHPLRSLRVPVDAIVELVERLSADFAPLMPSPVALLELNPVCMHEGRLMALDAQVRLGPPQPRPRPPRPLAALRSMLEARTMAIVGASVRSQNPGRVVVRNTLSMGFDPRELYVIKPGLDTLDGCPCVPDVSSLPHAVDLLVLAIPAEQVASVVEAALEAGKASAFLVLSGGLGERPGTEQRADALLRAIDDHRGQRPVVHGGNCLGVRSEPGRFDTLFIPRDRLALPEVDVAPVALLSQSGAFVVVRLTRLPWLRPRYVVSIGNQLDLTLADYLEVFAADPELRVVVCYVEGFRPGDGRRFLELARGMSEAGRSVILYGAGRTPEASSATASHTAVVAGDARIQAALAVQAGVLVADTVDELDDLVTVATHLSGRRIEGLRLGAISNAGFECVSIADHLGPLSLASLTPKTVAALTSLLETGRIEDVVRAQNPLDVTPMLDHEGIAEAARLMLADPNVDVGLVACLAVAPSIDEAGVVESLARLWRQTDKAWLAIIDGGPRFDALASGLLARGVPVVRSADRAATALGRYAASLSTWSARPSIELT